MITTTVIVSFIAALKDRPASRVPTPPISATSASGTPPGSRPLIRALGALCGLIYVVVRQTRIRVWAAMVAAVLVSRPQKI